MLLWGMSLLLLLSCTSSPRWIEQEPSIKSNRGLRIVLFAERTRCRAGEEVQLMAKIQGWDLKGFIYLHLPDERIGILTYRIPEYIPSENPPPLIEIHPPSR